jgi:hypothetical protein
LKTIFKINFVENFFIKNNCFLQTPCVFCITPLFSYFCQIFPPNILPSYRESLVLQYLKPVQPVFVFKIKKQIISNKVI